MKKALNLGCGTTLLQSTEEIEYINVDIANLKGVNVIHDLNKIPYPFESDSIDLIIMNNILEHLDSPIDVLQECYRILKKGCHVKLRVVYWNHHYTYADPQHLWAFSEKYFDFFTGCRNPHYMERHFSDMTIKYHFDDKAIEKYGNNPELLLEKGYFHCNIIEGMEVKLIK